MHLPAVLAFRPFRPNLSKIPHQKSYDDIENIDIFIR